MYVQIGNGIAVYGACMGYIDEHLYVWHAYISTVCRCVMYMRIWIRAD